MKSRDKNISLKSKKPLSIVSDTAGTTNTKKLVFSFEHFDENGHRLDTESIEIKKLVRHLKTLSSMTWQQIQNAPRHGLGSEIIPIRKLKVPITDIHSNKENVLVLRYSEKKPVIGLREGNVFSILFIDPNFDLYKH